MKVAAGANSDDYNWTEVMMREAGKHMDALSVHYYTVPGGWLAAVVVGGTSSGFQTLNNALTMQVTEPAYFGRVMSLTMLAPRPSAQSATSGLMVSIETGMPMVRIANTGITAIFDGYGRAIGELKLELVRLPEVVGIEERRHLGETAVARPP